MVHGQRTEVLTSSQSSRRAEIRKSTLVDRRLRALAPKRYRSADLVFRSSFFPQTVPAGGSSSAVNFLTPRSLGLETQSAARNGVGEGAEDWLSSVADRRFLLVLDGFETAPKPARTTRRPGARALPSRHFCASWLPSIRGFAVITTRMPVADLSDHEGSSALRRDLEQLSSDAGAKLLRALGVKGDEAELRSASDEFSGHCLALTLLGSYLTDAYSGDTRCRSEVSGHLAHDVRQGVHARKVMESYQTWLGEGPEVSVLRMLGLFDRPAGEQRPGALLKPPAIAGLTESLIGLSPSEWRTILAKLRRARLLAGEDPHDPGQLDAHPLVREYFGDQLRGQRTQAWQEANRRLYHHYREMAPPLPETVRAMEPLFLAVACGCQAGLLRDALHEVYLPRIQRGNASFAAKLLGARGALVSILAHFFEGGRWGSPVRTAVEGQNLSEEDQLCILMQAATYLTATRGFTAPEARVCSEGVESLCHSLHRPLPLYAALMSQWRYSLATGRLTTAMQLAQRISSLAQEQNHAALIVGAYRALATTLHAMGKFRVCTPARAARP